MGPIPIPFRPQSFVLFAKKGRREADLSAGAMLHSRRVGMKHALPEEVKAWHPPADQLRFVLFAKKGRREADLSNIRS
ncbi:MAG: hypothetical protein IIB53_16595 [Planctomycetes bacterium]|nr:hypothetical protein [Planctomycetota bacterium]